jgi:NCS1 family nucleobase:cation symporter-1
MACDYFIVRRSTLKLVDLYTPGPSSIYWYWNGINPKAPIVWALSVFPSLPGFAYTLSKGKLNVPIGWVHTSYLAWVLGS